MSVAKRVSRKFLSTIALVAAIACGWPADAARAQGSASPRTTTVPSTQIYLIKGLAGIFSSGMITLGEKLQRRGIQARVESHADSETMTEEIIRRYKAGVRSPIILVGHSLGADVAGGIARRLNDHRIPVALLITFGPLTDPVVTPNVAQAVNYYQAYSTWRGKMLPAPGFRGSLTNVNLDSAADVNHFNIEKVDRLQAEAINRIVAAMGGARKARPAPANAAAAPAWRAN